MIQKENLKKVGIIFYKNPEKSFTIGELVKELKKQGTPLCRETVRIIVNYFCIKNKIKLVKANENNRGNLKIYYQYFKEALNNVKVYEEDDGFLSVSKFLLNKGCTSSTPRILFKKFLKDNSCKSEIIKGSNGIFYYGYTIDNLEKYFMLFKSTNKNLPFFKKIERLEKKERVEKVLPKRGTPMKNEDYIREILNNDELYEDIKGYIRLSKKYKDCNDYIKDLLVENIEKIKNSIDENTSSLNCEDTVIPDNDELYSY